MRNSDVLIAYAYESPFIRLDVVGVPHLCGTLACMGASGRVTHEIRNPNPEGRRNSQGRRPNFGFRRFGPSSGFVIRTSEFFIASTRGAHIIGAPVKLSVKSDYAARAVLELARHFQGGEALKVEQLAEAQSIPANYLVQILIDLKSKHLVKSVRGKQGGYLLARPPAQITLGEVLRCIHGAVFDSPALSDSRCPPELRAAWKRLQNTLDETSDTITFQQLLDDGAGKERMYYI